MEVSPATRAKAAATVPETMLAAYQSAFGPPREVIDIRELPVPSLQPDQVLVRIAASSINALDWHYLTGTPYLARATMGLVDPKRRIPGADVAGTIVAVGDAVTGFRIGDEVFGDAGGGGFAEFAAARASVLAPRPANLSLEESATLGVAALTALQGLRDWAGLKTGERVLVNGASGGVGTFAVQIARALGAGHITAVCSTHNLETASDLGADRVVDYTKEEFTDIDEPFDVFFDNAGSRSLGRSRRMLGRGGRLVMITGRKGRWVSPVPRLVAGVIRSRIWSQSFTSHTAVPSGDDGEVLRRMVEAGAVRPVMDRTFTLDRAADALAYQGEGHARAKSIVVPR
ncbi:MAG: NAD(P)-dependent alcohol dehydrogenase [Acidimicrobiia bacterium]